MTERTKFAVIDCEDAPTWAGHESIWVAAYGRPGEHWCDEPPSSEQAAEVLTAPLALALTGSTSARSWASFRRRASWTSTVAFASPAGKALGAPCGVRCALVPSLTHARSHHTAYDETQAWIKELCEFVRVSPAQPAAPHVPALL